MSGLCHCFRGHFTYYLKSNALANCPIYWDTRSSVSSTRREVNHVSLIIAVGSWRLGRRAAGIAQRAGSRPAQRFSTSERERPFVSLLDVLGPSETVYDNPATSF